MYKTLLNTSPNHREKKIRRRKLLNASVYFDIDTAGTLVIDKGE